MLQVRENFGETVRRGGGRQKSGAHDQRPADGLRGHGGGKPGGPRVFPGPGDARTAAARRPPAAGRPHAIVPGRARGGGRRVRPRGRRRVAVAVRRGRRVGARGHRVPAGLVGVPRARPPVGRPSAVPGRVAQSGRLRTRQWRRRRGMQRRP